MKIHVRPNFSWVLILVLVVFWVLGWMNVWIALSIFIIYLVATFIIMSRNPVIQNEAQEFGQQIALNREREEKERIQKVLQDSVQIRRSRK